MKNVMIIISAIMAIVSTIYMILIKRLFDDLETDTIKYSHKGSERLTNEFKDLKLHIRRLDGKIDNKLTSGDLAQLLNSIKDRTNQIYDKL